MSPRNQSARVIFRHLRSEHCFPNDILGDSPEPVVVPGVPEDKREAYARDQAGEAHSSGRRHLWRVCGRLANAGDEARSTANLYNYESIVGSARRSAQVLVEGSAANKENRTMTRPRVPSGSRRIPCVLNRTQSALDRCKRPDHMRELR